MRWTRTAVGALSLAALVWSQPASPPRTAEQVAVEAADRLVAAGAGDPVRATQVALATPLLDPFLLVDELLGRCAAAAPAQRSRLCSAAALVAEHAVREQPGSAVLVALVADFDCLSPSQLRHEDLLRQQRDALAPGSRTRRDAVTQAPLLLAAPPPTLTPIRLLGELALALAAEGQADAALTVGRECMARASAVGWHAQTIRVASALARALAQARQTAASLTACRAVIAAGQAVGADPVVAQGWSNLGVLQFNAGQPAAAAASLRQAIAAWAQLCRWDAVAHQRLLLARALDQSGNPAGATGELLRARSERVACGDARGQLDCARVLAQFAEQHGPLSHALAAGREWLALAEALHDAGETVAARLALGRVALRSGQGADAVRELEAAVAAAETAAVPALVARAVDRLADALLQTGAHGAAQRSFERALGLYQDLGQDAGVAAVLGNLAALKQATGELAAAIQFLEQAHAAHCALGDVSAQVADLDRLGVLHLRLRDPVRALAACRASVALAENVAEPSSLRISLANLATALSASGDRDGAAAIYRRLLDQFRGSGDRAAAATTLGNLALCLEEAGQLDQALELQQQARRDKLAVGDRVGAAVSLSNAAGVLMRQGQLALASAKVRAAAAELETWGAWTDLAVVLERQAAIDSALGQHADALAAVRRAVTLELEQIADLGEAEARPRRGWLRRWTDLGLRSTLALAGDATQVRAAVDEALWLMESGQALALADLLRQQEALRRALVPDALREAEAEARDRVRSVRDQLLAMARQPQVEAAAADTARATLAEAHGALDAARARCERAARRTALVRPTAPATVATLRAGLPPGSTFIQFALGDTRAVALVITARESALVELGASPDQIRQLAGEWLQLVRTPGARDEVLARRLYDALLQPIASLIDAAGALVIAPDDILCALPFEALVCGDGAASQRLVQRCAVTLVPSATALAVLAEDRRTGNGRGLLAVGDPADPAGVLPRLPATGAEVAAVARHFSEEPCTVLVRAAATRTALLAAVAQVRDPLRAAHFACHGWLDDEHPLLSALLLAGGEPLTLDDVCRLRLPTDLVVLSACDSAGGRFVRGEGLQGLVRGFLLAGAASVVAAAWKIPDRGSSALMATFYQHWRGRGEAPAQALRQAKLRALAAGGAAAHPAAWAAFLLWGPPE